MGRFFQYNRLDVSAEVATKTRDCPTQSSCKARTSPPTRRCPAYSELYPEYSEGAVECAASRTTTVRRGQQWSRRLLAAPSPTTAASLRDTAGGPQNYATSAGDRELLLAAGRRPKVYDCMKDFLRRKLFQHSADVAETTKAADRRRESPNHVESTKTPITLVGGEGDVTSDYDEIDTLDSSYNADEEDASDCSHACSSASASASVSVYATSSSEDEDCELTPVRRTAASASALKAGSPRKSVLTLNCWQSVSASDSAAAESDSEADPAPPEAEQDPFVEDSDAGISDCCQLIAERGARRGGKSSAIDKTRRRSGCHDFAGSSEPPELMESSWYQPRITTKAALERLQAAAPGSFLVRRKWRSLELWLRVETKVKHFTVVSTAGDQYKLKGARKEFSSLKALVTHHSVMAEQLPLPLALPRDTPPSRFTHSSTRCADDFVTCDSLQILDILKSLDLS